MVDDVLNLRRKMTLCKSNWCNMLFHRVNKKKIFITLSCRIWITRTIHWVAEKCFFFSIKQSQTKNQTFEKDEQKKKMIFDSMPAQYALLYVGQQICVCPGFLYMLADHTSNVFKLLMNAVIKCVFAWVHWHLAFMQFDWTCQNVEWIAKKKTT